jgi:mono/diheme cytochrome c family protein
MLSTGGFIAMGGEMATGGATTGKPDAGIPDAGSAAAKVSFKTQIQPMLKTNCLGCHGPTKQNAGVRVDTYANVSASLQDIDPDIENGFMPPTGPLSAADMQLFQDWVDQGALNN